MVVEVCGRVLRQHQLFQRTGAGIVFEGCELPDDRHVGHQIADPQGGRDRLGERAAVDDGALALGLGAVQRSQRRRTFAAPLEIGVALVLEDRHPEPAGDGQDLPTAFDRHHRTGGVLDRRDRVDEPRRRAGRRQLAEQGFETLGDDPVVIEFGADAARAAALHFRDHPAVRRLFGDHDIARTQECSIDQVEGLQRAGHHQHLLAGGRHVRIRGQRSGDELSQRLETLRIAAEVVGGEVRAVLRKDCRGRLGQAAHWHARRVVVPADEAEARNGCPLSRGRGQTLSQLARHIERARWRVAVRWAGLRHDALSSDA